MNKAKVSNSVLAFPYYCCKNISGPEDKKANRKVLSGHAPASSFLDLDDNENVREYLVDAQGKQRRTPTLVHQAIRKTLRDNTDDFSILNSGIVIVASDAEVDDSARKLFLTGASIINGSQTQGELNRYLASQYGEEPHVKFEIVVTSDKNLVAEIAIARNFQNDVRAISIAGRRGQLDELEHALRRIIPNAKLRKSESDLSDDFIDSEKLIQVLLAISPMSLWDAIPDGPNLESKAFTYSQKTRCLKLFQKIEEEKRTPGYRELYEFFVDMAAPGWELYSTWKSHQGFCGCGLRKEVERGEDGAILDMPDGIIFPIVASYSAFCAKHKGHWKFDIPKSFDEKHLISSAVDDWKDVAGSNPQTMGKKKACYSRLLSITSLHAQLNVSA